MNRKLLRYLTAFLPVFFIFINSFAQSQSKIVKETLQDADRWYEKEKYEEARTLYLKNTASLSPAQQLTLGFSCMATSRENPERVTEAIQWIEKAANAGNTEAMSTLSYFYGKGLGVTKDAAKEILWLTKSAENGDDEALFVLGFRYDTGVGVEQNTPKAKELYLKAANKGNARAAFQLGALEGYEKPSLSAMNWLKKSADGQYLPAMLKLGELYEQDGETDEAVRLYTKMSRLEGHSSDLEVAANRKRAIGRKEPSTDLKVVKPLLLKLINAAATNFHGLLCWEKEPLTGKTTDFISTSTYYTSTLDFGFKNGLIRIEEVKASDLGNIKIEAGTHYSYSADIVYSVSEETALRVFEQWVRVLESAIPEWTGYRTGNSRRPLYTFSGKMTSGKDVVIRLSVSGLNSENVGISIANR